MKGKHVIECVGNTNNEDDVEAGVEAGVDADGGADGGSDGGAVDEVEDDANDKADGEDNYNIEQDYSDNESEKSLSDSD
jgi:hypothetical protein